MRDTVEETMQEKISRLETRIERLKGNMLSGVSRPRIIVGAVAIEEARSNPEFARMLLTAFDRGKQRLLDRKTIEELVTELEGKWALADRETVTAADRAQKTGRARDTV